MYFSKQNENRAWSQVIIAQEKHKIEQIYIWNPMTTSLLHNRF